MTISQSTLHEVAEAGRRILSVFESHLSELASAIKRNADGRLSNDGLYAQIVLLAELPEAALARPRATLAAEAAHYAATSKKNKREQKRRGVDEQRQEEFAPKPFEISQNIPSFSRFTAADEAAYEKALHEQREDEEKERKARGEKDWKELTEEINEAKWREEQRKREPQATSKAKWDELGEASGEIDPFEGE